jgi:CelD/BcsL family acetyltransferase involved in cellulose biosynthesis
MPFLTQTSVEPITPHARMTDNAPASSPCTVDIVSDAETLDRLQDEWKTLFETSPTASPPLRWDWVRKWWRIFGPVYGDQGRGLRIITVRRGGALVGVLPLYLRGKRRSVFAPRRLGFISTGLEQFEETCTEYLDLLHAPGEEQACCQALAHALACSPHLRCDELLLSELSENSPLRSLSGLLADGQRRVLERSPDVCHLFDMTGGFEAYLNRLSHENRRQARKMLREVDREGLRFDVAQDAAQARSFFAQMVELHRQRWTAVGEQGSFAPRHAEFHSTLAELLVPRGEAILARLAKDEKPLTVVFGYRVREKLHCYQQGVAAGIGRVRSPGTACWLLLMQRLAGEGVTVFDHLRGATAFKERFGTGTAPLTEIHIIRPSMRLLISGVSNWLRRGARRAWRTLPTMFGLHAARSDHVPASKNDAAINNRADEEVGA